LILDSRFAALVTLLLAASSCDRSPQREAPTSASPQAPSDSAIVTGTVTPGTIITLAPLVPREIAPPEGTAIVDQFGLQFMPAILAVRVGQRVEFRSSEDVLHNVRVDNAQTTESIFNVATPPFESYTHVFDTPGYYNVSCDVHPAMRANIFVAATPYLVVADDRGMFTVRDVQPGSYRVRAMLGQDRTIEQVVEVKAPRTEIILDSRF
jgi:plastocyanin